MMASLTTSKLIRTILALTTATGRCLCRRLAVSGKSVEPRAPLRARRGTTDATTGAGCRFPVDYKPPFADAVVAAYAKSR